MGQYIIQDIRTGAFVAYPGSASSFTRDILKARRFHSKEIAERERCPSSEVVVSIWDIIGH